MSKEKIILKKSDEFPEVTYLDGRMIIQGVCMPENAVEMFKPVFEFLEEVSSNNENIELNVFLRYLNSMSSKQLLRMIHDLNQKNNTQKVIWSYSPEDELMKMKGEEIKSILAMENFEVQPQA